MAPEVGSLERVNILCLTDVHATLDVRRGRIEDGRKNRTSDDGLSVR